MIRSSSGWLEVSISLEETLRVQPFSLARSDQNAWTLPFDSRPIRSNSASSLIRIHLQHRIKFRICRLRPVPSGVRCISSVPAVRPSWRKLFRVFVEWGGASILIGGDPVLMSQREKLISLARRYSLPAIYDRREYAEVGGLVS